jgi:hypothetical protein
MNKIIVLIALALGQMLYAQVTTCEWRSCNYGGECFYQCEDGVVRQGTKTNFRFACEGSSKLFRDKPNCAKVLKEEEDTRREFQRRLQESQAAYNRQQDEEKKKTSKEYDESKAMIFADILNKMGQNFVDVVNSALKTIEDPKWVNMNLEKHTANPRHSYEGCVDCFSYSEPKKGYGISFVLDVNGWNDGMYMRDYATCPKGVAATLSFTLKKGMKDDVKDECDFWETCEKREGMVMDAVQWKVTSKNYCSEKLKEFLVNPEIRKVFR